MDHIPLRCVILEMYVHVHIMNTLERSQLYQTGSIHPADNGEMTLSLFHSSILILEASHTDGKVNCNELDHIPLSPYILEMVTHN